MTTLPIELQVLASILGITLSLVAVFGVFIAKPLRRFRQVLTKLEKFIRDWEGEPEAPGRDRVPGVMERLNRLDGELKRNGGSTVKDAAVKAAESATEALNLVRQGREEDIAFRATTEARLQSVEAQVIELRRRGIAEAS